MGYTEDLKRDLFEKCHLLPTLRGEAYKNVLREIKDIKLALAEAQLIAKRAKEEKNGQHIL